MRELGLTLGETWTQETRDLLDEGVGSDEGIVLASELLDQLLVLVELLQILNGHGIDTTVLGTIDIVLVTENAIAMSATCPILWCPYSQPSLLTRCSCLGEGSLAA